MQSGGLDARIQSALNRNLAFAALRVTIKAELRDAVAFAFRRLLQAAEANALQQRLGMKAAERARWAAVTRGVASWTSYHAHGRRLLAKARRHAYSSAKLRGLRCLAAEVAAARRAERAERRRAARQLRTLLELHARLLFARWRVDRGAHRALVHRAIGASTLARNRRAWANWMMAVHTRERLRDLSRRAAAVQAAMRASAAVDAWLDLRASSRAAHRRLGRAQMHSRRIQLRSALISWRRERAVARGTALAARSIHHRMACARDRAFRGWVGGAAARRQAKIAARRAVKAWRVVCIRTIAIRHELPRRARAQRVRGMRRRGWRAWRRSIDARVRVLLLWGPSTSAGRTSSLRRCLRSWSTLSASWRRLHRSATVLLHRSLAAGIATWRDLVHAARHGPRALAVRHWTSSGLWVGWSTWHGTWAALVRSRAAMHRSVQHMGRRELSRGWCTWAAAASHRAASQRAARTLLACAHGLLQRRTRLHALQLWAAQARPLAHLARRHDVFEAAKRWRRAAVRLGAWQHLTAARRARCAAAAHVSALCLGGMRQAWRRWAVAAMTRARVHRNARGLWRLLTRDALSTWAPWAVAMAAQRAAVGAASAKVMTLRQRNGWSAWTSAYTVEDAVAARLWARKLTLTSERHGRALSRALRAWRMHARTRSRHHRWIIFGVGHDLMACRRGALRRWRRAARRRCAARVARPTPPRAEVSPLPPPPPPPLHAPMDDGHLWPLPARRPPPAAPPMMAEATIRAAPMAPLPPRAPLHADAPLPPLAPPVGDSVGLDALLDRMVIMRQCLSAAPRPALATRNE